MQTGIFKYWRKRPARGLRYRSILEKVDGGFQVSLKFLFLDSGERRKGDQWVEDPNLRFQMSRPISKENSVTFWGGC
jgi:hypothetical protein